MVRVEGLSLSLEGSEGRLEVRARSGLFADLPGRGQGQLEGVAFSLGAPGEAPTLQGQARRATLTEEGGLRLEETTIRRGDRLAVQAARAEVRPGAERVSASSVRAELRVP